MREKYCIDSVASFKEINNSVVNRSKSKQAFTFATSSRFQTIKPQCDKLTYNGDYPTSKRGVGIGYGQRSDFTKCSSVSPSGKYLLPSEFELNKKRARGSSMGLGREAVNSNQYISKEAGKMPASTKYRYETFEKYRSPSFSLRKRTNFIFNKKLSNNPETENPGPGMYNVSSSENMLASKFSQITYSVSKLPRFEKDGIFCMSIENGVPGVGHYQSLESISGTSPIKFSNVSRFTFIDEAKKNQATNLGPGSYRSPSQFGQYDGNVYLDSHKK